MLAKNDTKFNVAVIGAGYVGLVISACLAKLGNKVISVDNNRKKIELLKSMKIPNYEPGLENLVRENVRRRKLEFSSDLKRAVRKSDIIFIAVGTPAKENGEADLSAVERVAFGISQALDAYKLIVEKSTVPVRTGEKVKETIRRYAKGDIEFDVASNPEFLREGRAISDFLRPDRIVIGVESKRAASLLKALYRPLKAPIVVTDINTAELIKHASNSFLATKISFINAVSMICEKTGANIEEVALGMGLDRRIGKEFLAAGIGWGGSCFPKDVDAFIHIAKKTGYNFRLLEEVRHVNIFQRRHFLERIKEELWILKGKNIAILGLAFKPNTDDLRESPTLYLINELLEEEAKLRVYDPQAMNKAKKFIRNVKFCRDSYEAVKGADCMILATAWEEFKNLNFKKIKTLMRYPFVADGRNLYSSSQLGSLGFKYIGIGK